jgi:mxaJ protein
MSFRSLEGGRRRLVAVVLAIASAAAIAGLPGTVSGPLRVCADPGNLPFSKADESGFENRIATLLATELGTEVRYYWWPQRRGFVRNTLGAHACDVVLGVPAHSGGLLTTPAYYRAGYVFAYRPDRAPGLRSFDDPRLRTLRVGIPLVGNDMAETPPGHSLARRAMLDNVIGYAPLGATSVAERMFAGLAEGSIDVALLWEPQARYYATRQDVEIAVVPARDPLSDQPDVFAMAIGVRPEDVGLRDALASALTRAAPRIDGILREYGLSDASVVGSAEVQ